MDKRLASESIWTRHDHRGQPGTLERALMHALRLARVQGHPRLRKNVLVCIKGSQRDWAVEVRPGADDDGIDLGIGDQLFPVAVSLGDVEFPGDLGGGFAAPIADSHHADARNGLETGKVPRSRNLAGPDDSDADLVVFQWFVHWSAYQTRVMPYALNCTSALTIGKSS